MTRMLATASSIPNSSGASSTIARREGVALQRILIADREFLDPRAAAE